MEIVNGDTSLGKLSIIKIHQGLTDKEQDSLLWDGCKECGVHYPKDY